MRERGIARGRESKREQGRERVCVCVCEREKERERVETPWQTRARRVQRVGVTTSNVMRTIARFVGP